MTKMQVRVGNSRYNIIQTNRLIDTLQYLLNMEVTLHVVVFIDLLYINFICVLDDGPPSSPETEQIELSEMMPPLPKKSPGSHSDSGRGTLPTDHTGTGTSKSKTSEVCERIDNQ